jgi:hypothetical protein
MCKRPIWNDCGYDCVYDLLPKVSHKLIYN